VFPNEFWRIFQIKYFTLFIKYPWLSFILIGRRILSGFFYNSIFLFFFKLDGYRRVAAILHFLQSIFYRSSTGSNRWRTNL